MRLRKRISTVLVAALVIPLGMGVSLSAGATEGEGAEPAYVDRAAFFPVEAEGKYNGWHQGDDNGAGNYLFTDAGISLSNKAQILYGNDGQGSEDEIAVDVAEVANSLAIAGGNTADLWFQIPVFYTDESAEDPGFTTIRRPVAAEDNQWTLSRAVGSLAAHVPHELSAISDALGEHLVIGFGFFADTNKTAEVSSFTALGTVHSFAKAPVTASSESHVDRDIFFPLEVDGLYNGWHQGDVNGADNYEFTDEGVSLTNVAQILYGDDATIDASVVEVAGSLAIAGESTDDLWYQIPVFFDDLGSEVVGFTTLRKPVTATDELWTISRPVGDLLRNSSHDLTVIADALGDHQVIGYGFYVGTGNSAQVSSFTALDVKHNFTPAPVIIEPEEPVIPEPLPNFAQVVPSGDLNGDGLADLLAVDHDGVLWLYPGKSADSFSKAIRIGSGWANLVISSPGDFDGDGFGDLIATDDQGDLFFYAGRGNGTFGSAVQAGWGWSDLLIVPAGDVTGDGVADVLAIDSDGVLFYYAGSGEGGFKGKLTRVGHGWKDYDLYPAGDINGDGFADILSIDRDGNLFTHLGKTGGAFQKSFQSGKGWTNFELFAGSDANGDGLSDLYGRAANGDLFFYEGKTNGGFRSAVLVGKGW